MINKRTELEDNKYLEDTNKLIKGAKQVYIYLAERLHKIHNEKLYMLYHDKFSEYCEAIEIDYSVAMKLIKSYEVFCLNYGKDIDEIKSIDYTKLSVISPISKTKDEAEYWLSEAEVLSIRDLKKKVKEITGGVDQMECRHEHTKKITFEECDDCGERWQVHE